MVRADGVEGVVASRLMRALLVASVSVACVALAGCGVEETAAAPVGAGPACAQPDPSIAGPDAACGVFVSATRGRDGDPGTMEQPLRTLARAFAAAMLAPEGARRVYACAELFAEAAAVPAGVELWGGLDCEDGWRHVGATRKTTIAPGVSGVIALRVLAGDARVRVVDVRAEAADGVAPGESSIAALVEPGTPAELLRCELIAGDGAAGAEGERGGGPDAPAKLPRGTDGSPGSKPCESDVSLGGAPVVTVCEGLVSTGGKGGDGHVTFGEDGEDGAPVPENPDGVHGLGGWGENGTHTQCRGGETGHTGRDGDHGLGATGVGRISVDGWEGAKGEDAGHGLPGQGGGGGGGSRGPLSSLVCGGMSKGGGGGGSGGAGGCGGKGGNGGGPGGASIALIALSGGVELRESTLIAGDGGDGGPGGYAQAGGDGGEAGEGGGGVPGVNPGCRGAAGGMGGNGGFGGGGLGGISLALAYIGGSAPLHEDVILEHGQGGMGGTDSHPAVIIPGTTGEDGFAGEMLAFEAP